MRRAGIWSILFFLLGNCVDPFAVENPETNRILTVEGFITTLPKSHAIRLSYTRPFGPEAPGPNPGIITANVYLRDDLGGVEIMSLKPPRDNFDQVRGFYETSENFAAEVGRSYTLHIELQDGTRYQSIPELVNPVPEVDSLTYQAVRTASSDPMNDRIGVEVIAHFQDPAELNNNYFWNPIESDFVIIAEPELYHGGPLDCCDRCFHKDMPFPFNVVTVSDIDFNGLYQRRPIAYVVDNGIRFKDTYRLDMQHLSVSDEAYRFLRLVGQQVNLSGSVFDPPPANIRGNILNIQNPQEQVLGYFFASDERLLRTYIQKSKLDFVLNPASIVPYDCRDYLDPDGKNSDPRIGLIQPKLPVDPPQDWDPPED
jgi:hypothetical protein